MNLLQDVIGWDVRNWSRCLAYWRPWLESLDPGTAKVLVLGERNGGISLWFATLGFNVICTDRQMPGTNVHTLHQRWKIEERVSYAGADVFKLGYPDDYFDVVACKSVIGGLSLTYKNAATRTLENQKLAVMEIRRVLKPTGMFLGAENLTGTGFHMLLRKTRTKRKFGWRYLKMREIRWLFEGYSDCQQESHGCLGTQWFRQDGLNALCGWADRFLSRILPSGWLYISFIRARK